MLASKIVNNQFCPVDSWCCPEVADCVPNRNASGVNSWQPGRDCPIRMRKGASRARVGRHQGPDHICLVCAQKSPETQPSPLPSSISRFNYQRLAGPDAHFSTAHELPSGFIGGQLQIILWNGRGLHQHVIRLLFDNTEQLFNMSPEPWLLLLATPLSRSAHRHMIRSVFKFARLFCHHNPSALPNQKHSSQLSCPRFLLSQIGCLKNGSKAPHNKDLVSTGILP